MNDIFHTVGAKLVAAYQYHEWPEAPWLTLKKSEFHQEEAMRLFDRIEIPLRPALERAIDRWIAEGTWPQPTDIQAFFLGVRTDTVACFLLTLSTPDNIVTCPEKNEAESARRFLTTWWNHHGCAMYFYNRLES
jgi:hypothetical protein